MERICHHEFDAQALVTKYPAQLSDRNKAIVFEMSSPRGATHSGTISFTRWRQMPLPETLMRASRLECELREDFFTYETPPQNRVDWHLNFAHYDLFCAYGGPLFAQDEMQVAEHPALASLRHALLDASIKPLTVEARNATPALIMGVERRCVIATDPNFTEGRPYGLYGNNFARATEDAIRRATKIIDPPTVSNILAMEAPACGAGRYTGEQIEFVLATALTGFSAAVLESERSVSPEVQTAIHAGFWGCGAYGGNRELMPLLQMIAACGSGAARLVFHAGSDTTGYDTALKLLEELLPVGQEVSLDQLLSRLEGMGFEWGVSDGN